MRISTLDPISLNDVIDTDNAPFVMDGDLKIYFENEDNRREYMEMEMHGSENSDALKKIFDAVSDDPTTGTIN